MSDLVPLSTRPTRSPGRFATVLLSIVIASASGCGGSDVTTSAIDGGFGTVASAGWMRTHYGAGVSEYVLLTNVPGVCAKSQALTDALAEFSAAVDPTTSADTPCALLTDPFLDALDATAAMFPAGASYLLLDSALSVGAHQIGDDAFGELQVYSGLPTTDISQTWDPEGIYGTYCGLTEDPRAFLSSNPETIWALGGGTLRFSSATDATLGGSFDGELVGDGGAISARFQAALCESFATTE